MPASAARLLRSRAVLGAVLAALAVEAAVVGSIYWRERTTLKAHQNGLTFGTGSGTGWWTAEAPGLIRPPTRAAEGAGLDEAEEVLGVAVNGRARAYRLRALRDPRMHLINDLIDGRPVSVAYCDITNCVRAYTAPSGSAPLPIFQGGLRDGEMVLKVAGAAYLHRTGGRIGGASGPPAFPFEGLAVTRTRWGEWKRQHPETDVYEGD